LSQGHVAFQKEELWKLLVDTVHSLPMYNYHKHYVQEVMLKEKPEISTQELSVQINIPIGEAIVLLEELRPSRVSLEPTNAAGGNSKPTGKTLFDFGK
jgi:hypothetical protein